MTVVDPGYCVEMRLNKESVSANAQNFCKESNYKVINTKYFLSLEIYA